jgi:hypothetical protein
MCFDVEDGEGRKGQTCDSSMPNGKWPMRRKQAKGELKKGGGTNKISLGRAISYRETKKKEMIICTSANYCWGWSGSTKIFL